MLVPVVRRTTYPRIRCPAGQFFGGDKLSYYTPNHAARESTTFSSLLHEAYSTITHSAVSYQISELGAIPSIVSFFDETYLAKMLCKV